MSNVTYLKTLWNSARGTEILQFAKYKTKKLSLDADDMDFYYAFIEVGNYILNFCNRMNIPTELDMTIPMMLVDSLKYQWYTNFSPNQYGDQSGASFVSQGNVSSIKEGDTQVNYSTSSNGSDGGDALDSHTPNLDEWIYNYNYILLNYKLLYKI